MKKQQSKKALVKRYHIICSQLKMNQEDKLNFLSAWDAESSLDLTPDQLDEACGILEDRYDNNMDKWRKRVIACIHGWFKLIGRKDVDINYVKAIARRAAGNYDAFNGIPIDRLQNIYYSFRNKQDVFRNTGYIANDELNYMQFRN